MSRIGKKPVPVPSGVTANVEGQTVKVKGPKGLLSFVAPDEVSVKLEDGKVKVDPRNESKRARAMWGTSRTMVANLVTGVTKGFERKLEITGVGYRAAVQGKNLQLALGYSHDVLYPIPEGIQIATPKPTEITISGMDSQKVGQVAAEIRAFRPPEPYKGKGVKYAGGRQEEVTEQAMAHKTSTERRRASVRRKVKQAAGARKRLSVFRSSQHIYAQIIDDLKGETLVAASSLEKSMRESLKAGGNVEAAKAVGKLIAERALQKGLKDVVFDRGEYLYHGRVKALADAAREGGLNF
jgi:large subunit ribosomal protein L6